MDELKKQKTFESCIQLEEYYSKIDQPEASIYYLLDSLHYKKDLSVIYKLIQHY